MQEDGNNHSLEVDVAVLKRDVESLRFWQRWLAVSVLGWFLLQVGTKFGLLPDKALAIIN